MAELTQEQVERAAFVMQEAWLRGEHVWNKIAQAAAPFLQLPWDDVTEDEICEFGAISRDAKLPASNAGVALAISNFVRRRNAALIPKPADPRREKVSEALRLSEMYTANREQTIDRVIAALDEVK